MPISAEIHAYNKIYVTSVLQGQLEITCLFKLTILLIQSDRNLTQGCGTGS